MVETLSLWDRARSLGDTVRNAFAPAPVESDAPGAFGDIGEEVREMRDTIADRITAARATAAAANEDFSIEHYRKECVAFAETPEGEKMVAEGKWTPASYANLSGQDLQGIRLTNPNAIRPEHTLSPAIQADYDSFNRDGDGQINSPAVNQFYDRVTFDGKTDLRKSIVDPATSYNEEIAKAGNVDGLTINNLSANDPAFVFGACNYTNIHMTNIQGGKIQFGDNTSVTGLEIQGISADVTMGNYAKVSDVKPLNGFSMMNLSMGDGAFMSNADLTNATISPSSKFGNGAILQDVTLGANVSGINFDGVTFKNVKFNGSYLTETSFEGATLNGVAFNDVDINTLDFSGVKNLSGVTVNGKSVASANDLQMMRLADGVTIPTFNTNLNNAPSPAPAAQMVQFIAPLAERDGKNSIGNSVDAQTIVNVNAVNNPNDIIAAIRASTAATAITFGGDANFNTVTQTAAVTSQPRTIDPNDVPNLGSGNMNVGNA